MAKIKTYRAPAARVSVIRVPSASPMRRRAGAALRRGASAAAGKAREEKHLLTAVVSAAALGYAQKTGMALPKVEVLGTAGTYGIAAFALSRTFMKSRTLSHVATGLLSVAAFELAKTGSTSTAGDESIMGEIG